MSEPSESKVESSKEGSSSPSSASGSDTGTSSMIESSKESVIWSSNKSSSFVFEAGIESKSSKPGSCFIELSSTGSDNSESSEITSDASCSSTCSAGIVSGNSAGKASSAKAASSWFVISETSDKVKSGKTCLCSTGKETISTEVLLVDPDSASVISAESTLFSSNCRDKFIFGSPP